MTPDAPSLRLRPLREPFSPEAMRARQPTEVIDTPARQHLIRELERYVRGAVLGRSFLVAGHRGAGKTTMVLSAIEEVMWDRPTGANTPLTVRLSGPDLLPDPTQALDPVFQQLRHIAGALTRAAGNAFVQRFTERATDDHERALAAELRVELDQTTTVDPLRRLWDVFDVMERGVLYPDEPEKDRGLVEIAALWRAIQIHQRTAGTLDVNHTDQSTTTQTKSTETTVKPDSGKLADRLFAVFTGGLVGATLLENHPLLAAAAGLGAALASSLILQIYAKWERVRTQERKRTFKPDTGVRSLAELLPLLVAEMREVGLAPVFVVDELDKIVDPQTFIREFLGRMKSFVTDQSFFVFLVDRGYHEWLEEQITTQRFPPESTYFSDRLYVSYRPADLHRYVDSVLEAPDDRAEEGRAILRHVLLFRSRLHPHLLRAELQARVRETDTVWAADFDAVHGIQIYFQLAIERVLVDLRLTRRMRHDNHFAQRVLDTLYAVADLWRLARPVPLDPGTQLDRDDDHELSPTDATLVRDAVDVMVAWLRDYDGFVPVLRDAGAPRPRSTPSPRCRCSRRRTACCAGRSTRMATGPGGSRSRESRRRRAPIR